MFCREWLALLEQHKSDLKAAGLQVVAIGNGEPKHAVRVCGKIAPELPCLSEKTTDAHYTYGLHSAGLVELAAHSLQVTAAGARAIAGGHIQGETTGDVRMIPGSFIIDKAGKVQWTHYNAHPADHPKFEDILQAAQSLR
jgi:peroxiredoxin